jgi:shikimate dehydrogenase
MRCGLLGRKLGHSYSPQIHSYLGDYSYELFEVEPENLEFFLRHGDFAGLNVTMPYKQDVIPYLDELSPVARKLGAVNTIVRREDGSLIGHNTDYFGFSKMLEASGLNVTGKKVLVLGSGGASKPVISVLQTNGANVVNISRTGENHYGNLDLHKDAAIIVNTTPVGMYPKTGFSPIDIGNFPNLEGVLDIIFNPSETKLLMDAKHRGLIYENGLLMLVAQAKEASEWFTDTKIPDQRISDIFKILRRKMENIVLIGMPGCGKTTVGQILAEKMGKHFMDSDQMIYKMAGKSIPEIFAQDGEVAFRKWETLALEELGKQSNLVISTGGGCVTRPENEALLHQNGTVIWLTRNLEHLPTTGRPLSQATKLHDMYAIRAPLYDQFADIIIDNNSNPEATIARIAEALEVTL